MGIGLHWQDSFGQLFCIILAFSFSFDLEYLGGKILDSSGLITRDSLSIALYLAFY